MFTYPFPRRRAQLEQTVTKLQSVLALSPEQVAAIPPPLMRIRELETENELLRREVEELRRQLDQRGGQHRRDAYTPLPDDRLFDRESVNKRRRTTDGVYMVRVLLQPHLLLPLRPVVIAPPAVH